MSSVVSVKKNVLVTRNIKDFDEWKSLPNTVYIGRNMSFYVKGATESKWKNPFSVKKYGRLVCLEMYENYIRNSVLFDELEELQGKELGCWCKPQNCHGDILIKLLNEKICEKYCKKN